MQVVLTPPFKKIVKKLKPNQKADLDKAIEDIMQDPSIGSLKKGDLTGINVYKFKMVGQEQLLAYLYDDGRIILTLLSVGSRENFYQQLKRQIKGD